MGFGIDLDSIHATTYRFVDYVPWPIDAQRCPRHKAKPLAIMGSSGAEILYQFSAKLGSIGSDLSRTNNANYRF
jgi:hypothetical protein